MSLCVYIAFCIYDIPDPMRPLHITVGTDDLICEAGGIKQVPAGAREH